MVENKPHLILNFDINKTIILGDKSKNLDTEDGVRSCIADYAWGIYDDNSKNWTLTENYLTLKKPKPNLMNYKTFIKNKYKNKTEKEIPDINERFKKNQKLKKIRDGEILQFLNKGQPGEKLNPIYLNILQKVKIPENIMIEIKKENSKFSPFYKELYVNDYIFIFHSLFRLMIELEKENRIFVLIFRTFGYDFDDVIKEYNSFCEGKHPFFTEENGNFQKKYFDGTNNSKDYRIKENNIGIIYRFNDNIENCYLILGTIKRIEVDNSDKLYSFYKNQIDEGKVKIIKGGKNIFEYININTINGNINSLCINDHYETWYKYNKKAICGKPMFIDPENKEVEVFFFDDNIKDSNETSIVDCRNANTGETILSKDFLNKYLIIADTLKAIEDEYYYINLIKDAEKEN